MNLGATRARLALVSFLFVGLSTTSRADSEALPDDRLGTRLAPILLLSRADVRTDLRLDAKQTASAEQAIAHVHARAEALKGRTREQSIEGRKAINEAERLWFEQNLTTAQQNRLVQIDLQWEGPSALISRPLVGEVLGLTAAQREALNNAVVQRDAARAARTYTSADEQRLAKTALSILTPVQRERWRVMLGDPFVPQLASTKAADPAAR
jgi:hypothetical protein